MDDPFCKWAEYAVMMSNQRMKPFLLAARASERRCLMLDCTARHRIGLRGAGVPAFLNQYDWPFPKAVNQLEVDVDGAAE